VLLGACYIAQEGGHLGFYPILEITKKWQKMTVFDVDM